MTHLFAHASLAPRDPILGLNEQFSKDERPSKINLGIGVYTNTEGRIPILQAVQQAEKILSTQSSPYAYQPIDGISTYNRGVQHLLFEQTPSVIDQGRCMTVQALGGTGALKVGADLLKKLYPQSIVAISDPTWDNHRSIFEQAGFQVQTYRYYDKQTKGLNFESMLEDIKRLPKHAIVILHACCHNPTGEDLSPEQWAQIADIIKHHALIPFLDMAYQGFAQGVSEDLVAIQTMINAGINCLISSSFSKSFSLYGERVGALTIVTDDQDQTQRILSQTKLVIRSNYSSPPTHGAKLVNTILNDKTLKAQWLHELGEMRQRIQSMRQALVQHLKEAGVKQDFDFITQQRGMFSFSGLSAAQVIRLRDEHGIYAIENGRICVAALNTNNIKSVAQAIASVL